jgi:hypothetical protein
MRRAVLACLVVAVVAGGAGYISHRRLTPRPPPLEVIRIDRPLPRSARIDVDDPGALAMAADGRVLVAAVRDGSSKALLRQYLDKFDATEIPGTRGASAPFLSPDGAIVGFVAADGSLNSIAPGGDTPAPLLAARVHGRGATFGPEGQIIAGQLDGGLLRKTSAGSWAALTRPADPERAHTWPHWIPEVDAAVFTIEYAAPKPSVIGLVRLARPGSYVVVAPGQRAWFIDATHLIVARQDGLWRVQLRDGVSRGESRISADVALVNGTPVAAVGGGHLVYVPPAGGDALIGARVDQGATVFQYLVPDRKPFSQPRLSPDGQSVAVIEAVDAQRISLAVYDAATGTRTTSTELAAAAPPRWTADSRWVLFPQRAGAGWQLSWLARDPRDGAGPVLTETIRGEVTRGVPILRLRTPGVSAEWQVPAATGEGECQRVVETGADRWPDASGRREAGASDVVLAAGGRWLFFRQGSALLRREVLAGNRLGPATVVLSGGLLDGSCGTPDYDVSADGSRVIAVYRDSVARPSSLRYVLNFAEELRSR